MKKYLMILFAMFVGLAMISCSDDSVSIIEVPEEEEPEGFIYSINFNVEGGGTFTFSVDMDGATIEGEDLPDDFDGDVLEFDPESHEVFIAGSMVGWPEPGSERSLRLTRAGSSGGSIPAGNAEFKFFIVIDQQPSWGFGEWEGNPNRRTEVTSGGTFSADWGDQPEVEDPEGDFPESLFLAGNFQEVSGYGSDWSPDVGPQIPALDTGIYDGYVFFAEDGAEFKLVKGDDWGAGDFGGADGVLTDGGDNIVAGDAGYTRVHVNAVEMTYSLTNTVWGIIGDATPGGWDESTEMDFDEESKTWTITVDLNDGEMKFRANDSWDINVGDNDGDGTLQNDGGNIAVDAGNYTITLDLNGTEWTYTVEAN
ncbi:MAG: SusF/SusE family outer membrane protein [Balneolaceae bacterium]|nr:MAG: SusF/SusE family outer membrane protein [Balneolaceae bacterium]